MQTLHSLQICICDETTGDVTAAALTATDAGDAAGDAAVYVLN